MVRLETLAIALVCMGLACGSLETEPGVADCPDLDLQEELREQINPAALLEDGHYVVMNDKPLSKECLQKRVCQVNAFTRMHYHQSYYISLNLPGGVEIERQFPEIVALVVEGRGDERMIDLNNFCRQFDTDARQGEPDDS